MNERILHHIFAFSLFLWVWLKLVLAFPFVVCRINFFFSYFFQKNSRHSLFISVCSLLFPPFLFSFAFMKMAWVFIKNSMAFFLFLSLILPVSFSLLYSFRHWFSVFLFFLPSFLCKQKCFSDRYGALTVQGIKCRFFPNWMQCPDTRSFGVHGVQVGYLDTGKQDINAKERKRKTGRD